MIPGGLGKLEKMTIFAFTDPERSRSASPGSIEVMYNPSKYTQSYQVEFEERKGRGDANSTQVYKGIKAQNFSFEFVFDSTNASPSAGDLPNSRKDLVQNSVNAFLTLTGGYNGDLHRPNYLLITWGDGFRVSKSFMGSKSTAIKCVFVSANVDYTLFNTNGVPLRAKINATFAENQDDRLSERENSPRSPDLSHVREVEEEENLDLLSFEVYDDPQYYIQLAKHNNLKNFRRLRTGIRLEFPPLRTE